MSQPSLLRSIYCSMLRRFPLANVRAFWYAHPVPAGSRQLSEVESLRFLWSVKSRLPLDYVIGVLADVEPFVLTHGCSLPDFAREMVSDNEHGTPVAARTMLSIVKPFVGCFSRYRDPRRFILSLAHRVHRHEAPGSALKVVGDTATDDTRTVTLLLSYGATAPEKVFVDSEVWAGGLLQMAPLALDMEPFDRVWTLADARSVEDIIDHRTCSVTFIRDALYLGGERYGRLIDFYAFPGLTGLRLEAFGMPNSRVVLMERDFECRRRGRVILRAGSVYGAPKYLLRVQYIEIPRSPRRMVDRVIEESVRTHTQSDPASTKHAQMLRLCEGRFEVAYNAHADDIRINGHRIAKGISARILRKTVGAYLVSGKCEFDYQEFVGDPAFGFDPKRPNIDIRVRRLADRLRRECPGISIVKLRPGRFAFRPEGVVMIAESTEPMRPAK